MIKLSNGIMVNDNPYKTFTIKFNEFELFFMAQRCLGAYKCLNKFDIKFSYGMSITNNK